MSPSGRCWCLSDPSDAVRGEDISSAVRVATCPVIGTVWEWIGCTAPHVGTPNIIRLWVKMKQFVPSFKSVFVFREKKKQILKKCTEGFKHLQITLISPLFIIIFPATVANGNNNNHCSRIMLWLLSQIFSFLLTRQWSHCTTKSSQTPGFTGVPPWKVLTASHGSWESRRVKKESPWLGDRGLIGRRTKKWQISTIFTNSIKHRKQ